MILDPACDRRVLSCTKSTCAHEQTLSSKLNSNLHHASRKNRAAPPVHDQHIAGIDVHRHPTITPSRPPYHIGMRDRLG